MSFPRFSDGLRRFTGRVYAGPPILTGISSVIAPTLPLPSGATWEYLCGIRRAVVGITRDAVAGQNGFAGLTHATPGSIVQLERVLITTAVAARFRIGMQDGVKGAGVTGERFLDTREVGVPIVAARSGSEAVAAVSTDWIVSCPANDTVQLSLSVVLLCLDTATVKSIWVECETQNQQFFTTWEWTERTLESTEAR